MSQLLVVEESVSVGVALRRMLAELGHEVESATTGEQALDRLDHCRPDLVICDLRLADTDGLEVCRSVRDRSGGAIPVILIAAEVNTAVEEDARRAGAHSLLRKPFSPDLARVAVRAALEAGQRLSSRLNGTAQDGDALGAGLPASGSPPSQEHSGVTPPSDPSEGEIPMEDAVPTASSADGPESWLETFAEAPEVSWAAVVDGDVQILAAWARQAAKGAGPEAVVASQLEIDGWLVRGLASEAADQAATLTLERPGNVVLLQSLPGDLLLVVASPRRSALGEVRFRLQRLRRQLEESLAP